MELDVQVAHGVQEVGRDTWDRLGGERPFGSFRWTCFGEAVLLGCRPVYINVSRAGEPLARATFWVKPQEPVPVSARPVRAAVEWILRRRPLFLCQAPLAEVTGLVLPEPPLRDEALAVLARAAEEEARRHRASFIVYPYLWSDEARWPGWPRRYGAVGLPEPGTQQAVEWSDFDSYVRHLSTKSQRGLRSNCRRAEELGVTVRCHDMSSAWDDAKLDEIMVLVRNVERHHGVAPDPWACEAYRRAGMVDGVWLSAEIGERLVGCGLVVGDGGWWRLLLLGRDYSVDYAYFKLMAEMVRVVIERGARRVWAGTGSYETKRRLGFEVTDNTFAVFRGGGPVFQGLARGLARLEGRREQ